LHFYGDIGKIVAYCHVQPVLVKEKQLMQKFFIAPKESAAVKPQVCLTGICYLQ